MISELFNSVAEDAVSTLSETINRIQNALDTNRRLEKEFLSISYLQRMLRIGYNKSSVVVDILTDKGFMQEPDIHGKRKINR